MPTSPLQDRIRELLLSVRMPAQYIGGEPGSVVKPAQAVRGRMALAFPDAYTIGMSHHGLQVLYAAINRMDDWACERVFAPLADFEELLRRENLPLYGLESFTPLSEFDVVGFTLQYELCYTNVLTMLELGGIPIRREDRGENDPLIVAGGPSTANSEPMSRFIDVFYIGDGEEGLPAVCRTYAELRDQGLDRKATLVELARRLPFVYVPSLYQPIEPDQRPTVDDLEAGLPTAVRPIESGVPTIIRPAILEDFDGFPLPTAPVVPLIECVQDRIAIEIMRGCPGTCRFCQSTTTKRPIRFRSVETIVRAAIESYENTGYNEISLLSLSTSDYPELERLLTELHAYFQPLGVAISVPSLRINQQLRTLPSLLGHQRHGGLTLAPEAALDDMRAQIGKRITNDDLLAGCEDAFAEGFYRVKLYFLCGLPGERRRDLDGIIDLSEEIARLGRQIRGRSVTVVANVSNLVPKPQTPYQFQPMASREYFDEAHRYLRRRIRMKSVQLRYHHLETSLLEGLLARGDRRMGEVIETAWRAGAKFDAWSEQFQPQLWYDAIATVGIDPTAILHTATTPETPLPWNHIGIHGGHEYLLRHHREAAEQISMLENT